jgi:hypothetical protein
MRCELIRRFVRTLQPGTGGAKLGQINDAV